MKRDFKPGDLAICDVSNERLERIGYPGDGFKPGMLFQILSSEEYEGKTILWGQDINGNELDGIYDWSCKFYYPIQEAEHKIKEEIWRR